jgi:hypothetical protein
MENQTFTIEREKLAEALAVFAIGLMSEVAGSPVTKDSLRLVKENMLEGTNLEEMIEDFWKDYQEAQQSEDQPEEAEIVSEDELEEIESETGDHE